jgi:imidazole glycerol-phosphate synthase subunit HisH
MGIAIVNYGMGNIGSIANMLKKAGADCYIADEKNKIEKAEKIILPGVGAFDKAMNNLTELGFIDILTYKVKVEKIPVLGICLGMQILLETSEEGVKHGLGWIKGNVRKFRFQNIENKSLKIPHMGWNTLLQKKGCELFKNLNSQSRFYFVHSYYVVCTDPEDILAITEYGNGFVSAIARNNILGAQFHPEKSHRFGLQLLKNFSENF